MAGELDAAAERLRVPCESAQPPALGYLERSVLVELGGRSGLERSDSRAVAPCLREQDHALQPITLIQNKY